MLVVLSCRVFWRDQSGEISLVSSENSHSFILSFDSAFFSLWVETARQPATGVGNCMIVSRYIDGCADDRWTERMQIWVTHLSYNSSLNFGLIGMRPEYVEPRECICSSAENLGRSSRKYHSAGECTDYLEASPRESRLSTLFSF